MRHTRPARLSGGLATCVAAAWLWTGLAPARAAEVVILDRELRAQPVNLARIAGGRVYFSSPGGGGAGAEGAGGEERSIGIESVAAIIEPGWWVEDLAAARPGVRTEAAGAFGMIELTDGRRVMGQVDIPSEQVSDTSAPGDAGSDVIRWLHSGALGSLEFKLEDVARVRRAGAGDEGARSAGGGAAGAGRGGPERDRVLLTNGDAISGLVERIGLEVWVSDRGSVTRTPLARVQEIRLVNPAAEPRGTVVWLRDGSVIRVEHVGVDSSRGMLLGIEPSEGRSRQVALSTEQVRAIVPDVQRLRALSSLAITAQRIAPGRIAPMEPAEVVPGSTGLLGVGNIELDGPMSVEWALPTGAARVAGWLVLPASSAHWGDCVVRIEAIGGSGPATEIARESVQADRAVVAVNAKIPAGASGLRISLDEGPSGPIQDRVVLHRFVIAR
ncbi:MAG: hypothetical protein AB7K52_00975 [Phycisphaerales bacterium]